MYEKEYLVITRAEETDSLIVIAHNHPSGNLNPSRDDLNLTKNIITCCKPFDISVLDHIIIGNKRYLSFSEEGYLI
mgnify:FL=1